MTTLSYFDANIPCLAACPVHTNAGAYVAAIADGNDRLAYLTARLPNPFASVCGRVCAAPCEDACRRGEIDKPIAIRALKRFVTEKYGVEAGPGSAWSEVAGPEATIRSQTVGIVGGGPAGLAAAHDLRRLGYGTTVYEASPSLGGMMMLGIPEYRLDRRLLAAEIDAIVGLGVDVRLNTRLGDDVTLAELREQHDAVFLAIGASMGRGLDIEGHEADGVFRAIEFLLNVNLGFQVEVGERVIVVGGGNVAMDAARTALRAAAYEEAIHSAKAEPIEAEPSSLTEAVDVARTAIRVGAKEVIVVSLEDRHEMPAAEFEIEEAEAEGIRFIHRRGPARILTDERGVVGLETIACTSVFDADGRFAPEFDAGDVQDHPGDTVILAIGQAVDLGAFNGDGPTIGRGQTIQVDDGLATSLPKVWSGGDAAFGPRNLIEAIADGRRVAAAIHRSFGGEVESERGGEMVVLDQFHRLDDLYDRTERLTIPVVEGARRIGLREVETGFSEEQARCEAQRCFRCFANILLDVDKCVLCALCSDVCPFDLISLVPAPEVADGAVGTALLLDERACIRCGLCIERCPTDALTMGVWQGLGVVA